MPKTGIDDTPQFEPEPDTLVIEDQSLAYGFIQLPRQILLASNLTRDAKMLYAVLLHYGWQDRRCFPGYARLCSDLGASENMVRKYMRELEAIGLLSQKRRGLGKTNIYMLHDLRTAKIAVLDQHQKLRTAKTEVLEPHFRAAQEPAKTEGNIETHEIEKEEIDNSKIRKTPYFRRGNEAVSHEADTTADVPPSQLRQLGSEIRNRRPRTSVRVYDEARVAIGAYMEDYARELGDEAPLRSTVTRAVNLYH